MVRRLLVILLIVAAAGTAGVARGRLDRAVESRSAGKELLYLPNGKYLKIISLGHAQLLADAIYLWAIQYYSDYGRADRYRYVEHVFSNVITELDPHYVDAYWLGALILIMEAGDFEAGMKLLETGVARNPDNWILPYLTAWECYHAGAYERAADWFDRASAVPGAPTMVQRMSAGVRSKAGDLRSALRLWQEVLEDPEADRVSQAIAGRQIRDLQVRIDVEDLSAAIERFRTDNGRFPGKLEVLVRRAYIGHLPQDPDGRDYRYDAQSGAVTSPAGRVLGVR